MLIAVAFSKHLALGIIGDLISKLFIVIVTRKCGACPFVLLVSGIHFFPVEVPVLVTRAAVSAFRLENLTYQEVSFLSLPAFALAQAIPAEYEFGTISVLYDLRRIETFHSR